MYTKFKQTKLPLEDYFKHRFRDDQLRLTPAENATILGFFTGFWLYDKLTLELSTKVKRQTIELGLDFESLRITQLNKTFEQFKESPFFGKMEKLSKELKKLSKKLLKRLKETAKVKGRKSTFFQLLGRSHSNQELYSLFESINQYKNIDEGLRESSYILTSFNQSEVKKKLEKILDQLVKLSQVGYSPIFSPISEKINQMINSLTSEIPKIILNNDNTKFKLLYGKLNLLLRDYLIESSDGVFAKEQDFSELTKEDWENKAFILAAQNQLLKAQLEEKAREEVRLNIMLYKLKLKIRDLQHFNKMFSKIGYEENNLQREESTEKQLREEDARPIEENKKLLLNLKGDAFLKMLDHPVETEHGMRRLNIQIPLKINWDDQKLQPSVDPNEDTKELEIELPLEETPVKELLMQQLDDLNNKKEATLYREQKNKYRSMSRLVEKNIPIVKQINIFGHLEILNEADFIYHANPEETICPLFYNRLKRINKNKYYIGIISYMENHLFVVVNLSRQQLAKLQDSKAKHLKERARFACLKVSYRGIAVRQNQVFQVLIVDNFAYSPEPVRVIDIEKTENDFLVLCVLLRSMPLNFRGMEFQPDRFYQIETKVNIRSLVKDKGAAYGIQFWKTEHTLQDFDGLPPVYFIPSDDLKRWNEDYYLQCLKSFGSQRKIVIKRNIFSPYRGIEGMIEDAALGNYDGVSKQVQTDQ